MFLFGFVWFGQRCEIGVIWYRLRHKCGRSISENNTMFDVSLFLLVKDVKMVLSDIGCNINGIGAYLKAIQETC